MPTPEKTTSGDLFETTNKINKGFRLSPKTIHQLSTLAERMATSQTEIIERSIAECYDEYDRGINYFWADSINHLIKIDCISPEVDENTPHYSTVKEILDALYPEKIAEEGYAVFSVSDSLLVYLGEKYGFDDRTEEGKYIKSSSINTSNFVDNFDFNQATCQDTKPSATIMEQATDLADIAIALHNNKNFSLDQAIKITELAIARSLSNR